MEITEGLGFPDPYNWLNMMRWTVSMLKKFSAKDLEDLRYIRQRFIRPKCILCKEYCVDLVNFMKAIDYPVTFPCGHIMGWRCYREQLRKLHTNQGSYTCP